MERPHSSFSTMTSYSWPFFWSSRRGRDLPCCPCPVHPWRKKTCWLGSPALDEAADATVILTWWKLQDAIRDGGLWERGKSRAAALALRRHYRTAAARRPAFDHTVQTCLEELHQLEVANTPSLDQPADTFARILQAASAETGGRPDPWGGADPLPCGPVDLPGRRLGRPGPRPKGGGTTTPSWPGTATRRRRRRPPPGNHARLPGPWPKPLFLSAGLGPVGRAAGAHPIHRLAGGGGGSVYRPVEREKPSLSPSSRGRAPQRTRAIRRTIAYERSLCRVGCEPIRQ